MGRWKFAALGMGAAVVLALGLSCAAGTTCTAGTTECDGNTLKACGADGVWIETPCPQGTKCDEVSGVDTCVLDDAGGGVGGGDEGGGDEGGGRGAKRGKHKSP